MSTRSPIPWAIFLGISWTWCIGMYLPVLLVRDYGGWAWLIFAVPNVVGAAAMGWTMQSAEMSERFIEKHRDACIAFSIVTAAFQIFFVCWRMPTLVPSGATAILIFVAAAGLTYIVGRRSRGDLAAAGIVWLISLAAMAVWIATRAGPVLAFEHVTTTAGDVIGLAAACLVGFACCPYLDLTFHRARIVTSVTGGWAFGFGFGVVFCSMIVFTLLYAGSPTAGGWPTRWGVPLLLTHWAVQTGFTVAVHHREITKQNRSANVLAIVAYTLAAGVGALCFFKPAVDGEVVYRLFMSFYGLVAPAYVLTRVFGQSWAVTIAALVLASPFYYLAFIDRRMSFASGGAAILLAAGIFSAVRAYHRSADRTGSLQGDALASR